MESRELRSRESQNLRIWRLSELRIWRITETQPGESQKLSTSIPWLTRSTPDSIPLPSFYVTGRIRTRGRAWQGVQFRFFWPPKQAPKLLLPVTFPIDKPAILQRVNSSAHSLGNNSTLPFRRSCYMDSKARRWSSSSPLAPPPDARAPLGLCLPRGAR